MIIFGVSLTVLAVLVVGIAVARKIDGDSANYLVAGRRLGVPLVSVSLTAAAVDSNATVGNTDLTSQFGFWAGASLAIGLAICLLLAGIFLARPMNRMNLMTLGDFFRLRYGRGVEVAASIFMIFAFTILLAGNLVAGGFLLEQFARIPYAVGVVLMVALVLAYTVAGGLFSDAYTAAIQMTITVTAAVSLLVWTLVTFNGLSIPAGMGPFDMEQLTSADAGAPINWATLLSLGIGDLVAIDFMQRIFGAKSPKIAQRACYVGAGVTATIGTIFALVALTATSVLGLTTDNGPILFQLLGDYAPPLLSIVVLSGIVAASFSTASGAILATSAVAVRNVFAVRRMDERSAAEGKRDPLLRWTRLAMLPVVVIGSLLALRVSQTGILLTLAFDLMLAALAGPFLIGVFWKRPGRVAAISAMAVGGVSRVVLLVLTPTLYGVPNDLLYIPNSLLGAGADGWTTIIPAVLGFGTYAVVGWLRPRTVAEQAYEAMSHEELHEESGRFRLPEVVNA